MMGNQNNGWKIQKIAHWSSMYEPDAPAMALSTICWIQADERFARMVKPGEEDLTLLVLCLRGSGAVEFDGKKITLLPGYAFLLDAGCGYHSYSTGKEFCFIFLQIPGSFARQILSHLLRDRGNLLAVGYEAVSICEKIYTLARAGWSFEGEIRISCLLYELSGLLLIAKAQDTVLTPAVTHIHTNYARDITTEELASLCGLSVSQFILRFRSAYDVSPKRYLNMFRISRANDLLLERDLPVSFIAQSVGFTDSSYFTRLYKKMTGITPRQYRSAAFGLNGTDVSG